MISADHQSIRNIKTDSYIFRCRPVKISKFSPLQEVPAAVRLVRSDRWVLQPGGHTSAACGWRHEWRGAPTALPSFRLFTIIQSESNNAVNHQRLVSKEGRHLQTPRGKSSFLAFAHDLHSSSLEPQSIWTPQMSRLLTPPSVAGKVFVYLTNEVGLVLNSNGDLQSADSIKELVRVHGLGHVLLLEELWTNSHLHLHTEERPHPRPWRLKRLLPWKHSCNP